MSDETNVNAGSETSGETEVQSEQGGATETTDTETTTETSPDPQSSGDAGSATGDSTSETSGETEVQSVDANESRTAFVKGARPGEECTCPDGRKGTVHKFDEGLVCIPNVDQG